jgi:signal transduction histidine kinase
VIRTDAEIALLRPRTSAQYRESLARILRVSEGATGLIESLLTLARADGQSSNLKMRVVDAGPILYKVAMQISVLAGSKGLSFVPVLENRSLFVNADADAMEKLLLILLDNAVKYTTAPGFVWLRVCQADGQATFEVEDTGIGIGEEDQRHIFDRFYRADHARSGQTAGSGLGLAIGSWIAAAHQGTLEVHSTPGTGSLFRVRLPLANSQERGANLVEQPRTVNIA